MTWCLRTFILKQMVFAQRMGVAVYLSTVVAVDPAPAVGAASPKGTMRRAQNIRCVLVVATFSTNLHKCHLTTVGERHQKCGGGRRLSSVNQRQGYDWWGGSVSMCMLIFISFSRIWTSCCIEGRWPDSSLDQTGTSLSVISNAPVDMHWFSIILLKKNTIIQAYILFSWLQTQIPGACMPHKAKGSLPKMITPINNSLNIDRKEAMCL